MNSFDAGVCAVGLVAIISGFKSGLLRSMATIIGYLAAMPIAVAATPYLVRMLGNKMDAPPTGDWALFFAVFLAAGIAFGAALRAGVAEMVGERISLPDRLAGSMLGALRVALIAVTMVLICDRIIPADRQPAFLTGSQLRPVLLAVGQQGLRISSIK